MSRLERASELIGRPVVTLGGDSPGTVKDVVLGRHVGAVVGFTLNKHGGLHGPLKQSVRWASVRAVGRDAVMIDDASDLEDGDVGARGEPDVLGIRVISEDGEVLGTVRDAILELGRDSSVVGYEVDAEIDGVEHGRHVLVPFAAAGALSDEAVVVPNAARDYVADDLTGFGAAVESFRARLTDAKAKEAAR